MGLHPRELSPGLWFATSLILVSLVAVFAEPRWAVLAVPALLGLSILLADLWQARRLGLPLRPSGGALMLAASLVVATLIVAMDDPRQVKQLLPVLIGLSAVATTLRRSPADRCRIGSRP